VTNLGCILGLTFAVSWFEVLLLRISASQSFQSKRAHLIQKQRAFCLFVQGALIESDQQQSQAAGREASVSVRQVQLTDYTVSLNELHLKKRSWAEFRAAILRKTSMRPSARFASQELFFVRPALPGPMVRQCPG
jgi:hypothetical protein